MDTSISPLNFGLLGGIKWKISSDAVVYTLSIEKARRKLLHYFKVIFWFLHRVDNLHWDHTKNTLGI